MTRILEQREHLRKHTPQCQGVCTVLDPATFVPQCCCEGRCQKQGQTTVPGMGRQIQVSILEVPDIISQNVYPYHIRPQHILFVFGGVDTPPAGHTNDIEQTCQTVQYIPPAAVQPYTLGRQPPAASQGTCTDRRFKVRSHCDQDVDGHDHKRECLKPVRFPQFSPMVLQDHKSDTACSCRIQFRIVEPAVHMYVCIIVQCPFRTGCCPDIDGDKIHG